MQTKILKTARKHRNSTYMQEINCKFQYSTLVHTSIEQKSCDICLAAALSQATILHLRYWSRMVDEEIVSGVVY